MRNPSTGEQIDVTGGYPNFEHLEGRGQNHSPDVLKVIAEIERLRRKGP
jgi:hypothetical protein